MNNHFENFTQDPDVMNIQKAEDNKNTELFVEEDTNLVISELIRDEFLDCTARQVEDLNLNVNQQERLMDREHLLQALEKVEKIVSDNDSVFSYFDIPSDQTSMEDLIEESLLARAAGETNYQPSFVFSQLQNIDTVKFQAKIKDLDQILSEVQNNSSERVGAVMASVIQNHQAKMFLLISLKQQNLDSAFEFNRQTYGDVDEFLVNYAKAMYDKKIHNLKNPRPETEIEQYLKDKEFDAEGVKKYFDIALKVAGLSDVFEVVIDTKKKACTVSYNNTQYGRPIIFIPKNLKVDGVRLLQLIAHEIGVHAVANHNHRQRIPAGEIGSGWEVIQEGFAVLNEEMALQKIFGPDYVKDAGPYYTLAINKAKELHEIGEFDILKVYDYIKDLKMQELSLSLANKDSDYVVQKADESTKNILRRVFRGLYPYYFSKDLSYLKGNMLARVMCQKNMDKYGLAAKVDIKTIPSLIELGVFNDLAQSSVNPSQFNNIAKEVYDNYLKYDI